MRIFYNPETRQQIIVMENFACSIYLQSDETPAMKADEVINAYRADKKNVSICEEIILADVGESLPEKDGPKKADLPAINKTLENDAQTE